MENGGNVAYGTDSILEILVYCVFCFYSLAQLNLIHSLTKCICGINTKVMFTGSITQTVILQNQTKLMLIEIVQ